jgi:hypothetical protein
VTALIRYIYKELIDGCPAKLLLRPAQKFSQLHKLSTSTREPLLVALQSLAHIILDSSGVVRSRPMVVHLVGLGGSLDGRVAGVVLELVGCGRWLVILRVVRVRCWCSGVPSFTHILFNFRCFSSLRVPVTQKSEKDVQLARDPARELMPYAMITPVMNPFSFQSPFSKSVDPLRRSRFHPNRLITS